MLLSLILDVAVVAAVALAVHGAWLTARSLGGESRAIERRLARPVPNAPVHILQVAAATAQPSDKPAASGLDGVIDRILPTLRRRLLAARAPFTPTQLVLGSLLLFAGLFIVMRLADLPTLAALALATWGGLASPSLLIAFLARRRRRMFTEQLPQAVELIARSLQAGHPVTTALGVAAKQAPDPLGPEFEIAVSEMNAGLDRDVALRNLLQRFPIPELRMFAASLEVTRETGGNLAEVFLNLAGAMRAKAQLRKKVAALSAEGRISFLVVSILPLAVVGGLMLLSPQYYGEVANDRLFWPMMSVPPILWASGALIIWRMINFRV